MSKFKVGDRVAVNWMGEKGNKGTIQFQIQPFSYSVKMDNGEEYHLSDMSLELVTPPKPEVWIVSTLGGQTIDKHFFNEEDAREAAERFTQSCPKYKFYISKAIGYVEAVPTPTTRYVEL